MRTLLRGATMYREKRGSGMKQKKFYGIRVGLVVSEASVAVLRPEGRAAAQPGPGMLCNMAPAIACNCYTLYYNLLFLYSTKFSYLKYLLLGVIQIIQNLGSVLVKSLNCLLYAASIGHAPGNKYATATAPTYKHNQSCTSTGSKVNILGNAK